MPGYCLRNSENPGCEGDDEMHDSCGGRLAQWFVIFGSKLGKYRVLDFQPEKPLATAGASDPLNHLLHSQDFNQNSSEEIPGNPCEAKIS